MVAMAGTLPELSPRQKQALQCAARGLNYKQTAAEMGISVARVNALLEQVRHKYWAQTTKDAVDIARRNGVVE